MGSTWHFRNRRLRGGGVWDCSRSATPGICRYFNANSVRIKHCRDAAYPVRLKSKEPQPTASWPALDDRLEQDSRRVRIVQMEHKVAHGAVPARQYSLVPQVPVFLPPAPTGKWKLIRPLRINGCTHQLPAKANDKHTRLSLCRVHNGADGDDRPSLQPGPGRTSPQASMTDNSEDRVRLLGNR